MSDTASLGVLLDHAQDKIVLVDEAGQLTYCNDAVERMLGYTPAEMQGRNIFDNIHPEDVERARSAFERTIASESFTETTAELRYAAKDGSWVWLESRMSNLSDDEMDGYVVSSRDVTDRVAAKREREEMATRLSELTVRTQDVLWMFDGDWSEVLFVNPAYEELFGQSTASLEADPASFLDAIHPDDVPAVREAMATLSGGEPVDLEYRVNPARDYGVWVWVQAEPVTADGEVARITGFCRDITERRRRERQLVVMDNLLRHNIRNDMTVILGEAELLGEGDRDPARHGAVIRRTGEDLLESTEKQREIIDLLTGPVSRERVDLVEAVLDAVEATRERHPSAEIRLSLPDDARAEALQGIGLAVVELLENAVRYSERDPPTVEVGLRAGPTEVALRVDDHAAELSAMEANVLRGVHESNDVYHSSGLGLWLVYWLVELSEGRIEVDARSEGNRVQVFLPRAQW